MRSNLTNLTFLLILKNVKVVCLEVLLLKHAKTAKQIWMDFGMKVTYILDLHIGFCLSWQINGSCRITGETRGHS